jgi:hypothetical protein
MIRINTHFYLELHFSVAEISLENKDKNRISERRYGADLL